MPIFGLLTHPLALIFQKKLFRTLLVSQVCLRLFRGNLSLNEGDSAANAVSERNLQRKITKTRQQMQQKECNHFTFLLCKRFFWLIYLVASVEELIIAVVMKERFDPFRKSIFQKKN